MEGRVCVCEELGTAISCLVYVIIVSLHCSAWDRFCCFPRFLLLKTCTFMLCRLPLSIVAESAVVTTQFPTCRFWNVTSQQWSSSGVLTLGIVRDSAFKPFLSCASTHLTAFTGSRGGGIASRFSLNTVHPVDDAGSITVGVHCMVSVCRVAPVPLMLCFSGAVVVSVPLLLPHNSMRVEMSNGSPPTLCVFVRALMTALRRADGA